MKIRAAGWSVHRIREEVISYTSEMLEKLGPEDAETYIRIQHKIWNNFKQNTRDNRGQRDSILRSEKKAVERSAVFFLTGKFFGQIKCFVQ